VTFENWATGSMCLVCLVLGFDAGLVSMRERDDVLIRPRPTADLDPSTAGPNCFSGESAHAARRSLLGHAVAQLDIGLGTPSAVDYFARVLALVAQARTRPITSSGRTAVAWTVVSK